jgi:hypothetical protein
VTPADQYRALAARFRAHARGTDNPRLGAEWEHLARCYIRLAEQADRNLGLDLVYETPIRRDGEDVAETPDEP